MSTDAPIFEPPAKPPAKRSCPMCEKTLAATEFIASLDPEGKAVLSPKGVPELLCRQCSEGRPEKMAMKAAQARRRAFLEQLVTRMGKATTASADEFVDGVLEKLGTSEKGDGTMTGMEVFCQMFATHLTKCPLGSMLGQNAFTGFAKLLLAVSAQQSQRVSFEDMGDDELEEMAGVMGAMGGLDQETKLLEGPNTGVGS